MSNKRRKNINKIIIIKILDTIKYTNPEARKKNVLSNIIEWSVYGFSVNLIYKFGKNPSCSCLFDPARLLIF